MTKLQRLQNERVTVKRQVDLFERKYKQSDTIWHTTLKRLDKDIAKLKSKKTTITKKKLVQKETNDG